MRSVFREKPKVSPKDILYILVIVLFLFIIIVLYRNDTLSRSEAYFPMTQCWTDENGENISLRDLPDGKAVSLKADIGSIEIENRKFCIRSVDTFLDVYADGQNVYSYHPDIPRILGKSYGMYVHIINLPEGTDILELRAEPIFKTTHATLRNAVIEDSGKYIADLYKDNLLAFIRSNITMLIGAVFLIMGLSNIMFRRKTELDFISFGAMCVMFGFAGLNDTYILQLITQHPAVIRVVTYICVIFLPYPALAFFASAGKSRDTKLMPMMKTLCLLNFSVTVILTYMGISDYFHMVIVSHYIIILDFFASAFLVIRAAREHLVSKNLIICLSVGLAMCIIGAGIDMLRYHLGWDNGYSSYTRIAVLVFMMIIGIYIMAEQLRSMQRKQNEDMQFIREITESFAKVIDMKDKYTKGHSARVAKYTAMLARELGYDEETAEKYFRIALLHDIGKIAIPSPVLNKPGKLTDEEYEIIKSHTVKGYEALKNISIMPELAVGAGSHHERPDGKGYPNGLKGDEIPRVAQIIAVADTFDAMYSDRPYRKRMDFEKAVSIINEVKGSQLTEDVVDAFMRLAEKGELRSSSDTISENDK